MNAVIMVLLVVAFVLLYGIISDWYYGRQEKQILPPMATA
jgi:hypothetical protein